MSAGQASGEGRGCHVISTIRTVYVTGFSGEIFPQDDIIPSREGVVFGGIGRGCVSPSRLILDGYYV